MMFECTYCAQFSGRTFKKLLHHIKFVHSNEPNFQISCGHCNQYFKTFSSFKSHLRRKHNEQGIDDDLLQLEDIFPDDINPEDPDTDANDDEEEGDIDDENDIEKMTRFIALFVLKTKEENQLSQHAMDSILDNTASLIEQNLAVLKRNVMSCLNDNGVDWTQINGLSDILSQSSVFSKALGPVANEYLQVKYFLEKFNYVVSDRLIFVIA